MSNPADGRGGGSQGKQMPEWLREARNAHAAAEDAASAAHAEPARRYVRKLADIHPSEEEDSPAEADGWPNLPKKPVRRSRWVQYSMVAGLAAVIAAVLVMDWGSLATLGTRPSPQVERIAAQPPAPTMVASAAAPQERIVASSKPDLPPAPSQLAVAQTAVAPSAESSEQTAPSAEPRLADNAPRRVRTQTIKASREQQLASLPSSSLPLEPVENSGAAPASPSLTAPTTPVAPAAAPSSAQPARTITAEEAAILLRRGEEYLGNGDFAAARLMFQRAADTGNARGALLLAGTYDPLVLQQVGAYSFAADVAKARAWYEKAREFGSPEAPKRLEMLARAAQ